MFLFDWIFGMNSIDGFKAAYVALFLEEFIDLKLLALYSIAFFFRKDVGDDFLDVKLLDF